MTAGLATERWPISVRGREAVVTSDKSDKCPLRYRQAALDLAYKRASQGHSMELRVRVNGLGFLDPVGAGKHARRHFDRSQLVHLRH